MLCAATEKLDYASAHKPRLIMQKESISNRPLAPQRVAEAVVMIGVSESQWSVRKVTYKLT